MLPCRSVLNSSSSEIFGYALHSAVCDRLLESPSAAERTNAISSSKHSIPVSMNLHFNCFHRPFNRLPVLDEANVGTLLTETLTADVETVFSDQTSSVCADSTVERIVSLHIFCICHQLVFILWYPAHGVKGGTLTTRESPFHMCAGASTKRTRETCWVVAICDLRICRTIRKSSLVAEIDK